MLLIPTYDHEKGVATYFDPPDGDRLRAEWISKEVLPAFEEARDRHPEIRSAALVAIEGGPFFKPRMSDTISVHLLLSEGSETDVDLALQQRFAWFKQPGNPAPDVANAASPTRAGYLWAEEVLIPLFAAFCPVARPDSSGEIPAHGLLGRLQLSGDSVSFHPDMTAVRPWLDGLRSVDYPGSWEFDPIEGPQMRAEFLRESVIPLMEERFAEEPRFRSCMMAVAQYWDDNASDEVKVKFIFSELQSPDVSAENAWYGWWDDPVNRPNVGRIPIRTTDLRWDRSYLGLIPLFAAFCRGGATQDDDDAYAPYAVFRNGDEGVRTELVGVAFRPWLDGRRIDAWT